MRFTLFWLISLVMLALGHWSLSPAQAAEPKFPNQAKIYLPVLINEIETFWPDMEYRETAAGLVEQESNWKLKAALKQPREFGCGLAQFTRTFNKDGSVRFDALTETKALHKSLAGWNWDDCYNAQFQLRGMILKLKQNERSCRVWMGTAEDIKRCDFSAYNGGVGGFSKRIRMCRATPGCDPRVWTGHLEKQCAASNVKVEGYGESFCQINSKYPGRVFSRSVKYQYHMFPKLE